MGASLWRGSCGSVADRGVASGVQRTRELVRFCGIMDDPKAVFWVINGAKGETATIEDRERGEVDGTRSWCPRERC